jgi:tRNA(fMet)-specific endonuclease VapC
MPTCPRGRTGSGAAGRASRVILLDTDHTTLLKYPDSERARRMIDRLEAVSASQVIGVTIVTVEERMRGWLATIAKEKLALRQVAGYRELASLFEFYQQFEILHFDQAVARQFDELRRHKLRIGSNDLKIAATALVNHALLLSANQSDFGRVPGLRVENWLD